MLESCSIGLTWTLSVSHSYDLWSSETRISLWISVTINLNTENHPFDPFTHVCLTHAAIIFMVTYRPLFLSDSFCKGEGPWDALKNSNRQVKTSLFHFRSDIDGMCPRTPPSRSLTVIKIRKWTRFKSGWREKCESDIHPVMHGHACSLLVLQLVYGDSQFISKETFYILKYTVAHQALQLKRLWNYQVSQWPDWLTSERVSQTTVDPSKMWKSALHIFIRVVRQTGSSTLNPFSYRTPPSCSQTLWGNRLFPPLTTSVGPN